MVIHNFDGVNAVRLPNKTNAPLVIDANAVLSLSASRKRFKPVPRWYPQIRKVWCRIQLQKLAPGGGLEVPETSNINTQKQLFGIEALE